MLFESPYSNYQTSILFIGHGMHHFVSFQIHGTRLMYFVQTVGHRNPFRYDLGHYMVLNYIICIIFRLNIH